MNCAKQTCLINRGRKLSMDNQIYSCKAIVMEEGKRIKCTVNILLNKIQLLGNFSNNKKDKFIQFDNLRLLSVASGAEKIGLFKRNYIDLLYNGKNLKRIYFKNINIANSFVNAIKNTQILIQKEDEKKRRHEKKRKDTIFAEACSLMSKNTIESLNQAIIKFQSILDWNDSKTKIERCKNKVRELEIKQEEERNNKIYSSAVNAMNHDTPSSYKLASDKFKSILGWKDSKQLLDRCEEKLDDAYNAALLLMDSNKIGDFETAIKKFQDILGWKESQLKINICNRKIDEIKQKEENERRQKAYDAAVNEAKKDTINSYEKAIRVLSSLSGWKDTDTLIRKYQKRIEEIHIQEENARKEKTYSDALKIASGKTVKDQEKAIKLFTEVIEWRDAKQQIENCKRTKKRIEDAEFYNKIDSVIADSKNAEDNPQKYSDNLKKISKAAIDLFIKNPYFILGVSCTSEQNKLLDVKDKIEKFARLKLSGGYKSTYDLKNIRKPSRDLSSVQAAIVAAKDITPKWLWFETDKYCYLWDKDEIFSLYEKEKDTFEYDLLLACLLNRLICDPDFSDSKKWNTVLGIIDEILKLPQEKLLDVLKRHIGNMKVENEDIIASFKDNILKPITFLFDNSSNEQIVNFAKLSVPKAMSEAISSAIVLNVTNLCYPLDIYIKEVENDKNKTDIERLISLLNDVERNVYKNIEAYISIVGSNSTYAKRIKKKYKETIWEATTILDNNSLKDKSIPYIKEIYNYCDEGDKQRLRNTYGYEKLNLPESELTPSEMNSLAINFDEEGNINKSIYWLKKAAEAGDEFAQSNLAFRYFEGKGVPQNKATAKMWWSKAAAQGNSIAQEALDKLFRIPHEHYDLRYVYIGYGEQKYIEVALNLIAYVRLLDDFNYSKYIKGEQYSYYGGRQTQTPARIGIPESGHWHVVVDNDGDDMGEIKSLSCYTKTRSTY